MKYIFLSANVVALLYLFAAKTYSQAMTSGREVTASKKIIDSSAHNKWSKVGGAVVSDDGKYFSYTIENESTLVKTLVIQSSSQVARRIEQPALSYASFTSDSRLAIFMKASDTIQIISTKNFTSKYISNANSFRILNCPKVSFLIYQVNRAMGSLILQNLKSDEVIRYDSILNYAFHEKAGILVIQTPLKGGGNNKRCLKWIDLQTKKITTIWEGYSSGNFTFDNSGKRMAFNSSSTADGSSGSSLYYYEEGWKKSTELANSKSKDLKNGYAISGESMGFSGDGQKIFFSIKKLEIKSLLSKSEEPVIIWDYKDKYLKHVQRLPSFQSYSSRSLFRSIIDIRKKTIIQLEDEGLFLRQIKNNSRFVLGVTTWYPDYYYNKNSRPSYYLISTSDGERTLFAEKSFIGYIHTSPSEEYIVWFDYDSLSYFSYETKTGIKRNISRLISSPVYDDEEIKVGRQIEFGTAGWYNDPNESILIYDRFDIWKVDPKGKNKPINLTFGYGRKKNVVFGILKNQELSRRNLLNKKPILLCGFNTVTKFNGFWELSGEEHRNPTKLYMGPYSFNIPFSDHFIPRVGRTGYVEYASTGEPVRSRLSNTWLLYRMNATEAPNLFLTNNFKNFRQVSNIQPHSEYNWLTSELVKWATLKGDSLQGILYKPENFDPSKKYPVIFTYYEKRSDELNKYLYPKVSGDRLNIPTYVSNGYLVFVADILFTQGNNGISVVNSIVSAAAHMSRFSWADSTKFGLQGHSFGGWATNYIITHSHLFAAACEASGTCDLISAYNQLSIDSELDRQKLYEVNAQGSPYGVGVTPWTDDDIYIKNSPIFNLQYVKTPLLIMHGDKDGAVPFEQAIEMFLGMKRAGKKVWLLQYNNGDHSLFDEQAKDYTIRMQQFFDYYLKDGPVPKWMLVGSKEQSKLGKSEEIP